MFPAAILCAAALCGQTFPLPPAPAHALCRFELPAETPPPSRPLAKAAGRAAEPMVIGTVGVPAADGGVIPVVTDYATARRLAAAEGKALVVFAGPDASSLASKRKEHADGAVYSLGDPALFSTPGVYEFRAGDLVGGRVATASPPAAANPTKTGRAARFSCGPSGCFLIPE